MPSPSNRPATPSILQPTASGARLRKPDDAQGCIESPLWSYRALIGAVAVLQMTDPQFKAAMRDSTQVHRLEQVYKMLIIDNAFEDVRAEMRRLTLVRIGQGLQAQGRLTGLTLDIDYDAVPLADGIEADYINRLRPSAS